MADLAGAAPRWAMVGAIAVLVAARETLLLVQAAQPVPVASLFEEDAYYALAVARNLAHGHGLTADGSNWTNGFQPLWTLVVSIPYAVFGDERLVFASICLLSTALWLASAWLFARLVAQCIGAPERKVASWLSLALAALFLADLQLQAVYFNGLETGLYLTLILAVLVFIRPSAQPAKMNGGSLWPPVGVGVGLGVLILARNDGIFLAAALLGGALLTSRSRAALRAAVLCGGAIVATILPWLAFNLALAGSLVPQSGAATNAGPYASSVDLAKASEMLARLAQLAFTPFPMNYASLDTAPVPMAALLAVAALALCIGLAARRGSLRAAIRLAWPLAVAVVCLGAYYLVASGAVWMYDRYLMPFKLLTILVWGVFLATWVAQLRSGAVAVALAVLGVVVVSLYYQISAPTLGSNMSADLLWLMDSPMTHGDATIGMFESGRAGYMFPGRVVNLDGKTNLGALQAIQHGEFLQYLERSQLDVLVFRTYYVPWLDAAYPTWKTVFAPEPGELDGTIVSHRVLAGASGVALPRQ